MFLRHNQWARLSGEPFSALFEARFDGRSMHFAGAHSPLLGPLSEVRAFAGGVRSSGIVARDPEDRFSLVFFATTRHTWVVSLRGDRSAALWLFSLP